MCRILLIDDDQTDLFIGKKLLLEYDDRLQIETCNNGKMALDYLSQRQANNLPHPDIIICDINMPVMDGYGFLNGYADQFPGKNGNCCIVIYSSTINKAEIDRFNTHPLVRGFHPKPLQAQKIIESFRNKVK